MRMTLGVDEGPLSLKSSGLKLWVARCKLNHIINTVDKIFGFRCLFLARKSNHVGQLVLKLVFLLPFSLICNCSSIDLFATFSRFLGIIAWVLFST